MQYVDSSALVKRYVEEPDSHVAVRLLAADPDWVTAAHTEVEVRRTLSVRLATDVAALKRVQAAFQHDWLRTAVVQLDSETCRVAAELAELTMMRALDALHLAALKRAGAPVVQLLTFDVRQARTARGLGWKVVGAE